MNTLLRLPRCAVARLVLIVSLALLSLAAVSPARAQDPIPPPQHSATDENGVNLLSGEMRFSVAGSNVWMPTSNCSAPGGKRAMVSRSPSGNRSGTISKCKNSPGV